MAGDEHRQGREKGRGDLSPLPCSLGAADLVTNCFSLCKLIMNYLVQRDEKQGPYRTCANFLHGLLNARGTGFVRMEGDARKGGFGSTRLQSTSLPLSQLHMEESRTDLKLKLKLKLNDRR